MANCTLYILGGFPLQECMHKRYNNIIISQQVGSIKTFYGFKIGSQILSSEGFFMLHQCCTLLSSFQTFNLFFQVILMNRWTPPADTDTPAPSSGLDMTSQEHSCGQESSQEPSGDQAMTSLCYRGIHRSHDQALSYHRAHEFQRLLRLKVAHIFKVQLR